jgi:sugar lactone lactonase YvrE
MKKLIVIFALLLLIPLASYGVFHSLPKKTKIATRYKIAMIKDSIVDLPIIRRIGYLLFDPQQFPRLGSEIGDGGAATSAVFNDPTGVYVDSGGRIYVSERRHFRIRVIEDGKINTIAGNGRDGYIGDNIPAVQAHLTRPEGLDGDAQGNIYVADSFNHRIRRISPDGTIHTIAGTGRRGYSGDGGPATVAELNGPMDVKLGPSGAIYIVERDNHCVRRINPDNTIETIAGTGKPGFSGDGGPAINAQLDTPYGIAVDKFENVYITDSNNNRVRKVSPDGIIVTIAGTGKAGDSGDGGPALEAQFNNPQAAFVTPDMDIFIDDEHNHRIRHISPDGIVTTAVGTGKSGFSGDGGLAVNAQINDPEYLWVDSSKNLYVTDGDNQRLRRITPDGRISTIAGGGEEQIGAF